jgi:glucuronosyltransferase
MQQLSALFRDQPETPLQQAVYWTEYVLRHKGAHHMRSAALDLAWYQYFLLDVIGLMALCLAVIGLVAYKAIKAVKKYVCSSLCSKKDNQVKQNKKKD